MPREVYRKEALDRLSSPEQLDQLMPITGTRSWVALTGVGLLLLAGILWGIFGSVATVVEGSGLLMRSAGFQWVQASHAGSVVEILVDVDSVVADGDVLIRLSSADESGTLTLTEVTSPQSGRILDVAVVPGSQIEEGMLLLSIEAPESPLQAVVYVPATDGFKVEPGMKVKVLPATSTSSGLTYLRGEVKSASRFPATQAELMYSLHNETWVNSLIGLGPALEIVIDLTGDIPTERLYTGTHCDAVITVDSCRPIQFLLPYRADR